MLPRTLPRKLVLLVPLMLACQPEGCSCEGSCEGLFEEAPHTPVTVQINTPTSPASGLVPLVVTVFEDDEDWVTLAFPGLTILGGPLGGLSGSSAGTRYTYFWDSSAQHEQALWLGRASVIASDPEGNSAAETGEFEVHNVRSNTAPELVAFTPRSVPTSGSDAETVVVPLQLTDAESDSVYVIAEWSTNGSLWYDVGAGTPARLYETSPGGRTAEWPFTVGSSFNDLSTPLWFRLQAYDGFDRSEAVVTEPIQIRNEPTNIRAVRIGEVYGAGRSGVEVQNATVSPVDLEGWELEWTDASGRRRVTLPSHGLALDERVQLLAGSEPAPEGSLSLGEDIDWDDAAGSVTLYDPQGQATDFVRWGGSQTQPPTASDWVDDVELEAPWGLLSLSRRDYFDTNQASDWCLARPTPGTLPDGCAMDGRGVGVWVSEVDPFRGLELWNTSSSAIDLFNWQLLIDGNDLHVLSVAPLPSNERVWLPLSEDDPDVVLWGDTAPLPRWRPGAPGSVELFDAFGQDVDFVRWGGSGVEPTDADGWWEDTPLLGPFSEEVTYVRPTQVDTNSSEDWCLQPVGITSPTGTCLASSGPGEVLISEVRSGEPDAVELRPPAPRVLPLLGWSVHWSNTLGQHGWFTLPGDAGFHSTVPVLSIDDGPPVAGPLGVFQTSESVPWSQEEGGAVWIVDPYGVPIDFVRWGGSVEPVPPGLLFDDSVPLPLIPDDASLSREHLGGSGGSAWCLAPPTLGADNAACSLTP